MITIKAELAQRLVTKQPEQVAGELEDIAAASRRNLQLVRDIVGNMRQKGIADVLVEEEKNLHEAGIDVATQGEQTASAWPTPVQTGFGAVVQEACTNVIRHAHAHSVVIAFAFAEVDGMYTVSIQDDGNGKPPYDRDGSNGIAGMRERIAGQGGRFAIRNNDIGTLVTACIPYERPHEEPHEETA
ncbi:sensor histidine kinase [Bifidobacterium tibiigranuli]|jgi:two-component system sensor histidine kinase DesK|nr:histidine kinase [Bifidobacterium tibiigranuli]MCH3973912.1 histidine kinase [Bifidobacterium tibiigranuli]